MDSSLRNTQALLGMADVGKIIVLLLTFCAARINKLRDELIQHFETLVGRASVCHARENAC